jgi:hypothetical protein
MVYRGPVVKALRKLISDRRRLPENIFPWRKVTRSMDQIITKNHRANLDKKIGSIQEVLVERYFAKLRRIEDYNKIQRR